MDSGRAAGRMGGDCRHWVTVLGPGLIVASLTIGAGELIFSTRAGALFGYRTLGLFGFVLLLKWALVYASARSWVYSDVHPLVRWSGLPGPRGWLPWTLLVVAVPAFPVWVSFHSGTLGTLASSLTGTREALGGNASLLWAMGILLATWGLSISGGYARQERFQAVVVAAMLVAVVIALVLLKPDWVEVVRETWRFAHLEYPAWAMERTEFRDRPVWVEAATYAGVVGGSGFDYLAYVAWLRDKHGRSAERRVTPEQIDRYVVVDSIASFVAVLVFSGVFVVCGAMLLGPRHEVPAGSDLLTLQVQIVSVVGPWLKPLYFAGAFLALAGTLYGTIEVAPAVLREILTAVGRAGQAESRGVDVSRRWAVGWCTWGAFLILGGTLGWRWATRATEPFNLVALVTPANLLTGVLACGWISALNLWSDWKRYDGVPALGPILASLNGLGAIGFCFVGAKAGWDQAGWPGLVVVAACLAIGAGLARRWTTRSIGSTAPLR